jgi:hypothetical protein
MISPLACAVYDRRRPRKLLGPPAALGFAKPLNSVCKQAPSDPQHIADIKASHCHSKNDIGRASGRMQCCRDRLKRIQACVGP